MKRIWPFTFYVLYFGANASFLPYLVLYYQNLKFSGAQIGLLLAISPLITLVGAPLWTGVADASHLYKLVMGSMLLLSVGLVLFFPFTKTIMAVLSLVVLFSFFSAPVNSLADTATISMLGDERQMYGRIRIGGTIGWGMAAPLAGFLIGRFGLPWAFWSYAILMFMGFLVSQKLVFNTVKRDSSFKNGLTAFLSNKKFLLFLWSVFVCGMAFTSISTYLFAFMEQLGSSKILMGVALGVASISELPVLFFSDRLLARFKPRGLLIVAMVATTMRLFLYAASTSVAGILLFQLLHGLTFPALWVAGVTYADEVAPAGLSATAQGVFGAMLFGFGSAGGGFLSAVLFEKVGGAPMYAVFGAMMAVTLIAYILIDRRVPKVQYA
jgi:PPP family 3-phenylpropionic acid transporter